MGAGGGWRGVAPGRAGPGLTAPGCLADLIETFRAQLRDDPDVASAVVAIRVLLGFLKQDRGGPGSPLGPGRDEVSPLPRVSPHGEARAGETQPWPDRAPLPPRRGDHPGPEEQPAGRHRHPVSGGLLGGRLLRRGALPALHQPHLPGVLGKGGSPPARPCCLLGGLPSLAAAIAVLCRTTPSAKKS